MKANDGTQGMETSKEESATKKNKIIMFSMVHEEECWWNLWCRLTWQSCSQKVGEPFVHANIMNDAMICISLMLILISSCETVVIDMKGAWKMWTIWWWWHVVTRRHIVWGKRSSNWILERIVWKLKNTWEMKGVKQITALLWLKMWWIFLWLSWIDDNLWKGNQKIEIMWRKVLASFDCMKKEYVHYKIE